MKTLKSDGYFLANFITNWAIGTFIGFVGFALIILSITIPITPEEEVWVGMLQNIGSAILLSGAIYIITFSFKRQERIQQDQITQKLNQLATQDDIEKLQAEIRALHQQPTSLNSGE